MNLVETPLAIEGTILHLITMAPFNGANSVLHANSRKNR